MLIILIDPKRTDFRGPPWKKKKKVTFNALGNEQFNHDKIFEKMALASIQ